MALTLYEARLPPVSAAILGPVCTQAVLSFRSPTMPTGVNYALLPCLGPMTKPWGFASLDALARRIHRDRKGDALQMKPAQMKFRDRVRQVVEILAEDAGGRARRIGFAYVAGRDAHTAQQALQAALERIEPTAQADAA